jgi:hypothetical protein
VNIDSVSKIAMLVMVTLIGSGTLLLAFKQMKPGYIPQNLRVVGIVLVATLVSLLAILNEDALEAAIGILGAIIGYLFGFSSEQTGQSRATNAESTERERQ